MADLAYRTRSLMVELNPSILGTCSFLDAKFRYMPRSAISYRSEFTINIYMGDFETTFQVQIVGLFDSIFNVLYFSIFNHNSCGKHNVSGYRNQESNAVDVHEVAEYDEFILSIKYDLGDICHYNKFHILDLVEDCFDLQMWHTGSIYFLGHSDIFSHNWEILQDFVINCMQYFIYLLAGDVLEFCYTIIPLYTTGS